MKPAVLTARDCNRLFAPELRSPRVRRNREDALLFQEAAIENYLRLCFGEEPSAFFEVTCEFGGSGRPRAVINRHAIS